MSRDTGNNGECEEMQELPLNADQAGLVGQTVYRDGRQREGACPEFTGEVLAAAELLGFRKAGRSQHVLAQCPPAPDDPRRSVEGCTGDSILCALDLFLVCREASLSAYPSPPSPKGRSELPHGGHRPQSVKSV